MRGRTVRELGMDMYTLCHSQMDNPLDLLNNLGSAPVCYKWMGEEFEKNGSMLMCNESFTVHLKLLTTLLVNWL